MTWTNLHYRLGILAICLFAFAVRLHLLEDIFWHDDEAKSQQLYVQQPIHHILTHYTPNNHWLASGLGHLMGYLGEQRFLLRWPSVVWGVLAVPLIGVTARQLFRRPHEGLIAALLLSLSAFHVQWSQQFRGYSGLLFFGLLSYFFLYRALKKGRNSDWVSFIISTLLMLASHLFALLMVMTLPVILLIWTGSRVKKELKQTRWILTVSLGAFLVSGYFIWFAKVRIIDYYHTLPEVSLLQLIDYQIRAIVPTLAQVNAIYWEVSRAFTAQKNLQLAMLLFWGPVLAGVILSLRPFPQPTLLLVSWLGLPLILVTLAEFAIAGFFVSERYLIFVLPAWLLWVSRCLAAGADWLVAQRIRISRFRVSLGWALPLLVIGYLSWLNLSLLQSYLIDRAGHDWRNIAAYLAGEIRPNDLIICKQLPHAWPPHPSTEQDRCAKEVRGRLIKRGKQPRFPVVPLETATALSTWFRFREESQHPGAVWLILWGAGEMEPNSTLETLAMLSPLERHPETRIVTPVSFNRLGETILLKIDGAPRLASNLGEGIGYLAQIDTYSQERFDYYLHQAQVLAYQARTDEAQMALNTARRLVPEQAEAQDYLARTTQVISFNFLQENSLPLRSLRMDFGHPPLLRLTGYKAPASLKAGQTGTVTTVWQSLKPVSADYTIFLHLRNPAGRTVAQLDFRPFEGSYPTSLWSPGLTVAESRPWRLPPDLPPGSYTLHLGLYHLEPLTHLLPVQPAGQEPMVVLGKLSVR